MELYVVYALLSAFEFRAVWWNLAAIFGVVYLPLYVLLVYNFWWKGARQCYSAVYKIWCKFAEIHSNYQHFWKKTKKTVRRFGLRSNKDLNVYIVYCLVLDGVLYIFYLYIVHIILIYWFCYLVLLFPPRWDGVLSLIFRFISVLLCTVRSRRCFHLLHRVFLAYYHILANIS